MKGQTLICSALMAVALLSSIALVQAIPLTDKNNEKFETFTVKGTYSVLPYIFTLTHEYIPSVDQINKLVIAGNEPFVSYQIKVGSKTYTMGVDFVYTGYIKLTFFDPVFANPNPAVGIKYPSSYRESSFMVDYTYDFSAKAGGLDGTLQLHAKSTPAGTQINSIIGTGDLKEVHIQATALPADLSKLPLVTISHDGQVFGWPE